MISDTKREKLAIQNKSSWWQARNQVWLQFMCACWGTHELQPVDQWRLPWLQAEGFWNDTGVSSYTTIRFHSHERALLTDSCIEWHRKQLARYCFYPRERFIVEPCKQYSFVRVHMNCRNSIAEKRDPCKRVGTFVLWDAPSRHQKERPFIPGLKTRGFLARSL